MNFALQKIVYFIWNTQMLVFVNTVCDKKKDQFLLGHKLC